jgi:putative hydrolase of the HAD superfamily
MALPPHLGRKTLPAGDNRGMQSPATMTRAVLFDLGGVLLDIDFDRAVQAWTPHSRLPPQQVRESFRFDDAFHRHETGHLDDEGFFAHLRQALALECELPVVQEGFNRILIGEIDETVRMLEALRERVPCYAISNTNPAHVAHIEQAFPRFLGRFTRVFTSHEIGHRKPQPAAFEHVLREIAVPPPQVLLFDDLAANVDAARALGLQAVLVTGPADVRAALAQRGLLDSRAMR